MSNSKLTGAATPRPWTISAKPRRVEKINPREVTMVYGDGITVAELPAYVAEERPMVEANAALVVRAVNAHDALVAACKAADCAMDLAENAPYGPKRDEWSAIAVARGKIRAALALANGGGS